MAPKLSKNEQAALQAAMELYERALDLLTDGEDGDNLTQVHALLLNAVAASPLCSAAYIALADLFALGDADRLQYWRSALSAAELELGDEFEGFRGEFWGWHETRPFMRAKEGLADCLLSIGQVDAAVQHYAEMLDLNPTDNQGVREILVDQLMRLKRLDEAEAVLARYPDDWSAWMGWSGLLLSYLRHGASEDTLALLAEANLNNPHILPMLTGAKRIPKAEPEMYSPGSKEEAVIYARQGVTTWRLFPEALDWLKTIPKSTS